MTDYTRRGFLRNAFTLASGLAVASFIPGVNPLERIAMASDSDDPAIKGITVGASKEEIQKAIERINYHREQAFRHYVEKGLLDESVIKVEEDPKFTDAANKHARYLLINDMGRSFFQSESPSSHNENPNLMGYTPEGEKAGKHSCISPNNKNESPSESIDHHISSLYHKIPFINPRIRKFGIGFADRGNYLFSVIGGYPENTPTKTPPILYPGPNQKDVPIEWDGRENPNPIPGYNNQSVGPTITTTFLDWPTIDNEKAFLLDNNKFEDTKKKLAKSKPNLKEGSEEWWDMIKKYAEVPCYLSSPEKPANEVSPTNSLSICLIPDHPLKINNIYNVHMSATLTDYYDRSKVTEWKQTWSFKTISRKDKKR